MHSYGSAAVSRSVGLPTANEATWPLRLGYWAGMCSPADGGVLPDGLLVGGKVDAEGLAVGHVAVLPLQGKRGSKWAGPWLGHGSWRSGGGCGHALQTARPPLAGWGQPSTQPAATGRLPRPLRCRCSVAPFCMLTHLHATQARLGERRARGGGDGAQLLWVLGGDVGDVPHNHIALQGCRGRHREDKALAR